MDLLSFADTVRSRIKLKSKGLRLSDTECTMTPQDLIRLNRKLLTGEAAREIICDFQCMLDAAESDDVWYASLGVRKPECITMLLIGIADTWRRLVLPSQCLPWQVFTLLDEALSLFGPLEFRLSRTPLISLTPLGISRFTCRSLLTG